jgi:hypothetical protein
MSRDAQFHHSRSFQAFFTLGCLTVVDHPGLGGYRIDSGCAEMRNRLGLAMRRAR